MNASPFQRERGQDRVMPDTAATGERSVAGCEALGTPVISGAVEHCGTIHIQLVGNGSDASLGGTGSHGACPLSIGPLAMRIVPIERYATAARDRPRHEFALRGIREAKSYPTFDIGKP
jgi:hypothetical protein